MTPRIACAIAAGALAFLWPALLNRYPLLFSDTAAFMDQLLIPFMIWDKPWIYGPALVVVSLTLTLWLPALAQSLLVSWTLWRVHAVFRAPSPAAHLALCAGLALGSAAPWFTALLMPDIFAPLTVLTLFALVFDPRGESRWSLTTLASFAIAAHLSHLLIAAACLAVALVLKPRAVPRAALPLAAAAMLLLATNLVGHGRPGLSPYGAVFGLARLTADGPARRLLEQTCPEAGYQLCAWTGRLPADADAFLWSPSGPVWSFPGGPIGLAPEAARIVIATILSRPAEVARAALANTAAQFFRPGFDTVLGDGGLAAVGAVLHAHYPAAEVARFDAGAQRTNHLRALAAPWRGVQGVALIFGAAVSIILLARCWRCDLVLFALIAMVVAGLVSNAFATGALSGPSDRYQARIAWLVLLPPAIAVMRGRRYWRKSNAWPASCYAWSAGTNLSRRDVYSASHTPKGDHDA